jgi:hypothetical protein
MKKNVVFVGKTPGFNASGCFRQVNWQLARSYAAY